VNGRRLLLRLYPPGWRQRYGDEFDALLDDLDARGGRARVDVILGAIDARLHRWRYPVTSPSAAPRWPAWVLLLGSAAVGVLTVSTLWRYPGNLHDPAAPVYLVLLGVVLAGYLGCAAWRVRRPLAGRPSGMLIGLVAGAMWCVEIWAGGPAMLSHAAEQAVGGTFALLAVGVTIAAGVWVGVRVRDRGAAVRAGLFAGLTSGVVVFIAGTAMTLATLHTLGSRTDYQRQFAGSHVADMATFLAGDVLAAVIAHLVINLVLGMIGGGIGALIATLTDRDSKTPMVMHAHE
jgi:hypothetical protein